MIKNQKRVIKLKGKPEEIKLGAPAIILADCNGSAKWIKTSPVINWNLTAWGDFKLITKNSIYYGCNIEFC